MFSRRPIFKLNFLNLNFMFSSTHITVVHFSGNSRRNRKLCFSNTRWRRLPWTLKWSAQQTQAENLNFWMQKTLKFE